MAKVREITKGRMSTSEIDYIMDNKKMSLAEIADGLFKTFKTIRSEAYIDKILNPKTKPVKAKRPYNKKTIIQNEVVMLQGHMISSSWYKTFDRIYQDKGIIIGVKGKDVEVIIANRFINNEEAKQLVHIDY